MGTVIGHSITHRLRDIIPQIRFLGETCIVVGYGVLGKPIAHDMRNLGLAVHVCELVRGCTGLDALTYENLTLLPDECYVATVSSNEIKQSYPLFDKFWKLSYLDNYGRVYTSPEGKRLIILANGASLNLFNAEGAVHADYQPFLASMVVSLLFLAESAKEGKELPLGLNTKDTSCRWKPLGRGDLLAIQRRNCRENENSRIKEDRCPVIFYR